MTTDKSQGIEAPSKILLHYKNEADKHYFLAGDIWSMGVCAFNEDLQSALDDAMELLHYVLEGNHGIMTKYTPDFPAKDLEELVLKAPIGAIEGTAPIAVLSAA